MFPALVSHSRPFSFCSSAPLARLHQRHFSVSSHPPCPLLISSSSPVLHGSPDCGLCRDGYVLARRLSLQIWFRSRILLKTQAVSSLLRFRFRLCRGGLLLQPSSFRSQWRGLAISEQRLCLRPLRQHLFRAGRGRRPLRRPLAWCRMGQGSIDSFLMMKELCC